MAEKTLKFETVTPERNVVSVDADSVIVPAYEGYLGVLPGHAPLITSLSIGVARFKVEGKQKRMALNGGFMEVADNKVTILADAAELADEIDVERARAAEDRARERLRRREEEHVTARAQMALQRALARIEATEEE